MRTLLITLVAVVISLATTALGEVTGDSDQTERETAAWERLQQATDPDIVAIRQVLEVLVQDHRPRVQAPALSQTQRINPMDVGRVRALEDRIRRLESELTRLRTEVGRLR